MSRKKSTLGPRYSSRVPKGRDAGRRDSYDGVSLRRVTHPSNLVDRPKLRPTYTTSLGAMYATDALDALAAMPDASVNLTLTSPPYALEFKKEYGNAAK